MKNITIMLDFGGVLMRTLDTGPRRIWEERFGLVDWGLAKLVFDNPVAHRATIGEADTEDVWSFVRKHLDLSLDDLRSLKRDFWDGDSLNLELIKYVHGMSDKCRAVILSNAWTGARQMFKSIPELDFFEEIIISSEVGIAKPDDRVFLQACQIINVEPKEVIFVDDMKDNVNASISLGMHGVLFDTTSQVVKEIDKFLREHNMFE